MKSNGRLKPPRLFMYCLRRKKNQSSVFNFHQWFPVHKGTFHESFWQGWWNTHLLTALTSQTIFVHDSALTSQTIFVQDSALKKHKSLQLRLQTGKLAKHITCTNMSRKHAFGSHANKALSTISKPSVKIFCVLSVFTIYRLHYFKWYWLLITKWHLAQARGTGNQF